MRPFQTMNVSQRLMKKLVKVADSDGGVKSVKHGRDPGSNPGGGVRTLGYISRKKATLLIYCYENAKLSTNKEGQTC